MIPWMWDVALFDILAMVFFLALSLLPMRKGVRIATLAAAGWCLIETVGHAWMENTVAEIWTLVVF